MDKCLTYTQTHTGTHKFKPKCIIMSMYTQRNKYMLSYKIHLDTHMYTNTHTYEHSYA